MICEYTQYTTVLVTVHSNPKTQWYNELDSVRACVQYVTT